MVCLSRDSSISLLWVFSHIQFNYIEQYIAFLWHTANCFTQGGKSCSCWGYNWYMFQTLRQLSIPKPMPLIPVTFLMLSVSYIFTRTRWRRNVKTSISTETDMIYRLTWFIIYKKEISISYLTLYSCYWWNRQSFIILNSRRMPDVVIHKEHHIRCNVWI